MGYLLDYDSYDKDGDGSAHFILPTITWFWSVCKP